MRVIKRRLSEKKKQVQGVKSVVVAVAVVAGVEVFYEATAAATAVD